MDIYNKIIEEESVYIIAEIGINHNGDIDLAKKMIDAAKLAGADCVKFQTFITNKYISHRAGRADYQNQKEVGNKSQREIIQEAELSIKQTEELMLYSKKINIDFLSTPFEVWSLRALLELKIPVIKISSCNLTNYPFLEEVAGAEVPVLLSTGMGDMCEVVKAVEIFKREKSPLLLFQCTSNYPSKIENANLRVLKTYHDLFDVPVGFSDHTPTLTAAIAAVALGAVVIEKHFTLSRKLPGIDQKASIEPDELAELVNASKECKAALGEPIKRLAREEINTKIALRRSLVAAKDISSGEILTNAMVSLKRPGDGLSADYLNNLLGKKLIHPIKEDELLSLDFFLPE